MTAVTAAFFEFSPERFLQPGVIAGVVLMVIGLVCVLASKVIADILPQKADKPDFWQNAIRIAGAAVLAAGALLAIFTA